MQRGAWKIITHCALQAAQRADSRTQLRARLPPAQMEMHITIGSGLCVRVRSDWEKFLGTAIVSAYTNLLRSHGTGPDESEFIQERKVQDKNESVSELFQNETLPGFLLKWVF